MDAKSSRRLPNLHQLIGARQGKQIGAVDAALFKRRMFALLGVKE